MFYTRDLSLVLMQNGKPGGTCLYVSCPSAFIYKQTSVSHKLTHAHGQNATQECELNPQVGLNNGEKTWRALVDIFLPLGWEIENRSQMLQ